MKQHVYTARSLNPHSRVRVGSRRSALAQVQARLVMEAVRAGHPDVEFELVTVQTTGDVDMRPFSGASDPFGINRRDRRRLGRSGLCQDRTRPDGHQYEEGYPDGGG